MFGYIYCILCKRQHRLCERACGTVAQLFRERVWGQAGIQSQQATQLWGLMAI